MIKTEIESKQSVGDASESGLNTPVFIVMIAITAALIGVVSYLVLSNSGQPKINATALKQANVQPLPLATNSSFGLSQAGSSQSSYNQSSNISDNLGSNLVNLQNNTPQGQGIGPTTNSLQSAAGGGSAANF